MDNFMVKHKEYLLRTRMNEVHDLYRQAIFRGDLVLEVQSRYKSLSVRSYRLRGTFWKSTAILFDGSLIAIIAENDTIYDYVNMYHYSEETLTTIHDELCCFIKAIDKQDAPVFIYPIQ